MSEEKLELIKKNDKRNKIGWFLEIPPGLILIIVLILSFLGTIEIILVLLFFNLSYLFVHLIYYGIIGIKFYNKLGELNKQPKEIVVLKEPQIEKTHYVKCAYCGYETPDQFKKCSHCGAVL